MKEVVLAFLGYIVFAALLILVISGTLFSFIGHLKWMFN